MACLGATSLVRHICDASMGVEGGRDLLDVRWSDGV